MLFVDMGVLSVAGWLITAILGVAWSSLLPLGGGLLAVGVVGIYLAGGYFLIAQTTRYG